MLKNILIIISLLFLFLIFNVVSKLLSTEVVYQSSEGGWKARDDNLKGSKFDSVIVLFEYYKLKCNKPDTIIQRITKKPKMYSLEDIVNDYNHPKWRIPYAKPHEHLTSYKKLHSSLCYSGKRDDNSKKMFALARVRAKKYLNELK